MTRDPAPLAARGRAGDSYLDWTAVLAGTVFAAAISLAMQGFGGAAGLSMTSPKDADGASSVRMVVVAGLWCVWVMASSFGAGGYVAGRLRRRIGDATGAVVERRDGVHGLVVWATVAVAGAALGMAGVIGAGQAAAGRADVVAAGVDVDYHASVMLRDADVDDAAQTEIAVILRRAAIEGEIAERDRIHVAGLIADGAGLAPDAARSRVEQTVAAVTAARASALAGVERARVGGMILGVVAAAALLASAGAAFIAATLGGRHRDADLGFDTRPR